MKYVPNILTIIRFILIPFIIISIALGNYYTALIIFIISSITDVLDGYIARKCQVISDFGKLMDPLADKLTQLSILLTLAVNEIIPFWIVAILILKEVVMISGASFLYGKKLVVSSRWYGKLATVIFYIAIITSFIINYFSIHSNMDQYIYYVALVSTIFALIMYFREFYQKGYVNKKELSTNDRKIILK
jgi:cardiolipin synthase